MLRPLAIIEIAREIIADIYGVIKKELLKSVSADPAPLNAL
ncbi:hypothetical protein BV133_3004 [Blastochloris viridis]|uniref:Uncharacterized protein n=1 Tax=Blastochloris viridis TaxID=1079 RepID=A0A182D6M3_BLAVI|nr:hypothetical protein BV133_3004 [Blastochloris viridis]